jgi:hypothetical protein
MAAKTLPCPTVLRQLISYDAKTGQFYWKPRNSKTVNHEDIKVCDYIAKNWNTRFANKKAFESVSKRGYNVAVIFNKKHYAHRVAWAMHYGKWPTDEIDHINGDRLDNRIENLREVSRTENSRNLCRQNRNKTGVIGVWWDQSRNKYQAYIRVNGKRHHLGRFDSLEDAAKARECAARDFGFHENHGRDPL